MIADADLVRVHHAERGYYAPCFRAQAEAFVAEREDPANWTLEPWRSCAVCGSFGTNGTNRCYKHREHTPCSIEGCTKGRKFKDGVFAAGSWICGVHWRQVCPPRSPLRRTYLRFYRIARKLGIPEGGDWPPKLEQRYWRFFAGMIRRYHRGMAGWIDVDEINKLFGWEE
jgi:hypothetical protein